MKTVRTNGSARGRRKRTTAAAMLLSFGLVAAACSSDEAGEPDDTPASATQAPATEEPAEEVAEEPPAEPAEEAAEEAAEEPAEEPAAEPAEEPAEEPEEEPVPPSGDPIKVMVTGVIESPILSLPSAPLGAQVAALEINAAGGINGRPVEVLVCNDEFNPNVGVECVQQAISDGAVALVGGLSLFEPLLIPLLEDAGVPWVGNSLFTITDSPVVFPVAADGATAFAGIGAASVLRGCEAIAVINSAQGTDDNGVDILAGIEAFGGTVTGVAKGNGPDFAPLVEAALADGADCIASGVSPIEFAALLRAVAGRVPITTVDASVPEGLAASLGSEVDGVHVVSGFLLPGSGHPETVALVEASEELGPDVSLDQFWFSGYVGLQLVAEALEGADESNAAATLAGLTTISGYDSGVGPVIDFSTPNANPALSQLFNPELYLWEIVGGQYQLLQEDTIDMSSAIELVTRG